MWESESIPDGDLLFRRVHKQYVVNGELQPNAFSDQGPGMSAHWQRYCTPQRARSKAKVPADNGIVSLRTGSVRDIPLEVSHTPSQNDRSHTTVMGEKTAAVRVKLWKLANWEVRPDEAVGSAVQLSD